MGQLHPLPPIMPTIPFDSLLLMQRRKNRCAKGAWLPFLVGTGGATRLTTWLRGGAQMASDYFIHPGYQLVVGGLDVAIIQVAKPLSLALTPILVSYGPPVPGEELVAYG
jgi:hypothetical protein